MFFERMQDSLSESFQNAPMNVLNTPQSINSTISFSSSLQGSKKPTEEREQERDKVSERGGDQDSESEKEIEIERDS